MGLDEGEEEKEKNDDDIIITTFPGIIPLACCDDINKSTDCWLNQKLSTIRMYQPN